MAHWVRESVGSDNQIVFPGMDEEVMHGIDGRLRDGSDIAVLDIPFEFFRIVCGQIRTDLLPAVSAVEREVKDLASYIDDPAVVGRDMDGSVPVEPELRLIPSTSGSDSCAYPGFLIEPQGYFRRHSRFFRHPSILKEGRWAHK